jgi:CheY-like chemotaxis protein
MYQDDDGQFARSTSAWGVDTLPREASFADLTLSSMRVYVNAARPANRTPNRKSVGETVALVLEDDPDQLALAMRRLTTAGYRVQSADRVQAFYHRLKTTVPDVILLDIELPDGNGFDVLAAVRRDPRYASVPIMMLTACTQPEDIMRGLMLGADGYITKPYGRDTLEYALGYVMRQEVTDQPIWPYRSSAGPAR